MKSFLFSQHALDQMPDRGATREEVEAAIRTGELTPAKGKRLSFRRNFPFNQGMERQEIRNQTGHAYSYRRILEY